MSTRGTPCEDCGLRALLDGLVGTSSRCPHWLNHAAGIIETNTATNEMRLLEGCSIIESYRLMGAVIVASNRPAAAVESMRNEVAGATRAILELAAARIPKLVTPDDTRLVIGKE